MFQDDEALARFKPVAAMLGLSLTFITIGRNKFNNESKEKWPKITDTIGAFLFAMAIGLLALIWSCNLCCSFAIGVLTLIIAFLCTHCLNKNKKSIEHSSQPESDA